MKKLAIILLSLFISITFKLNCFAADTPTITPSLSNETNEILKNIDYFKSIDKSISLFAKSAYKNKALHIENDETKKFIEYEYSKIKSFEIDLLSSLREEKKVTNNYNPNKLKLLIGISYYKLSCENLLSFIKSNNPKEEYIYFWKYTISKSTGLENMTSLERFLKGGI